MCTRTLNWRHIKWNIYMCKRSQGRTHTHTHTAEWLKSVFFHFKFIQDKLTVHMGGRIFCTFHNYQSCHEFMGTLFIASPLNSDFFSPFWNVELSKYTLGFIVSQHRVIVLFFVNFVRNFFRTAKSFGKNATHNPNEYICEHYIQRSGCIHCVLYSMYFIKYAKRQSDRMMTPAMNANTLAIYSPFKYW